MIYIYVCMSELFIWVLSLHALILAPQAAHWNSPCGRLWCWETRIRNLRTLDPLTRTADGNVSRAEKWQMWWGARMEGWWRMVNIWTAIKKTAWMCTYYIIYDNIYIYIGMILTNDKKPCFWESRLSDCCSCQRNIGGGRRMGLSFCHTRSMQEPIRWIPTICQCQCRLRPWLEFLV